MLTLLSYNGSSETVKQQKEEKNMKLTLLLCKEAVSEATAMINSSNQPVIIAGVEIHRFSLQDKLLQLIIRQIFL